jgi:desulfoferrodoxin (superoxide reductase-like protein)
LLLLNGEKHISTFVFVFCLFCRYSDFIVNEIDENGKVVELTNLEVDISTEEIVCNMFRKTFLLSNVLFCNIYGLWLGYGA